MLGKIAQEWPSIAAAVFAGGAACVAALVVQPVLVFLHRRWLALHNPAQEPEQREGAAWMRSLRRLLVRLGARTRRRVPKRLLDALGAALRRAGRPHGIEPEEILAGMQLGALVFLLLGAVVLHGLGLPFVTCLFASLLGAAYPLLWLRDRVRARHRAIARALPAQLDLLTLSVEAGLDFSGALAKVVEKGRAGPLSDELGMTLKALKLGKTREEALRDLAARVGLPALSSLAQALIQADRMGTPLAKVLRILSTQLRLERSQRAEKLANEAPVKLLLPLIGCIFPTLFLMLFGPIAYQMFAGGGF